jgi:hypothetical protein
MILVGECCGWDLETEMLNYWRAYRRLFPHQPTQSRFNRRRRQLSQGLQLLRQALLRQLDLTAERLCAIDSQPLPVVTCHHAPRAARDLPIAQELLAAQYDRTILGDGAYLSRPVAAELRTGRAIELLTLPRVNHRVQLPKTFHRPFKAARFIIETVNS